MTNSFANTYLEYEYPDHEAIELYNECEAKIRSQLNMFQKMFMTSSHFKRLKSTCEKVVLKQYAQQQLHIIV